MSQKLTIELYSTRYDKGVCPKCGSQNIYKHKERPWGCYDCKWGFWEQHLDVTIAATFCRNIGLSYVPHLYTRFKKKVKKKKKSKSDGSKQLSLF